MLSPEQADEVRALLAKDVSHRAVAERLGIHRGTVRMIAVGRHWTDRARQGDRPLCQSPNRPVVIPRSRRGPMGIIYPDKSAPMVRCPRCRVKVFPPCLACQLRAIQIPGIENRRGRRSGSRDED